MDNSVYMWQTAVDSRQEQAYHGVCSIKGEVCPHSPVLHLVSMTPQLNFP